MCHSDIAFAEGAWGTFAPTVFGHEIAGVVEEVGPGAELRSGDRVLVSLIRSCGRCHACRDGRTVHCETQFALDHKSPLRSGARGEIGQGLRCAGFADHVTVHRSQVVSVPAEVSFASAAVVACAGVTGIGAVRNTAQLPMDRNVVVIGAGGVGLNAIQAAALCSPTSLVAFDTAAEKLSLARSFGAAEAHMATGAEANELIRERTHGRGAEFVFVTVGAPKAIEDAIRMTARGGTVVLVGMPATGAAVSIEAADLAADEIRVVGSKMGSTDLQRDVPTIFDDYQQGRIRLDELVSEKMPLDRINDAFAAAKKPATARVVLEVGSGSS